MGGVLTFEAFTGLSGAEDVVCVALGRDVQAVSVDIGRVGPVEGLL